MLGGPAPLLNYISASAPKTNPMKAMTPDSHTPGSKSIGALDVDGVTKRWVTAHKSAPSAHAQRLRDQMESTRPAGTLRLSSEVPRLTQGRARPSIWSADLDRVRLDGLGDAMKAASARMALATNSASFLCSVARGPRVPGIGPGEASPPVGALIWSLATT